MGNNLNALLKPLSKLQIHIYRHKLPPIPEQPTWALWDLIFEAFEAGSNALPGALGTKGTQGSFRQVHYFPNNPWKLPLDWGKAQRKNNWKISLVLFGALQFAIVQDWSIENWFTLTQQEMLKSQVLYCADSQ